MYCYVLLFITFIYEVINILYLQQISLFYLLNSNVFISRTYQCYVWLRGICKLALLRFNAIMYQNNVFLSMILVPSRDVSFCYTYGNSRSFGQCNHIGTPQHWLHLNNPHKHTHTLVATVFHTCSAQLHSFHMFVPCAQHKYLL